MIWGADSHCLAAMCISASIQKKTFSRVFPPPRNGEVHQNRTTWVSKRVFGCFMRNLVSPHWTNGSSFAAAGGVPLSASCVWVIFMKLMALEVELIRSLSLYGWVPDPGRDPKSRGTPCRFLGTNGAMGEWWNSWSDLRVKLLPLKSFMLGFWKEHHLFFLGSMLVQLICWDDSTRNRVAWLPLLGRMLHWRVRWKIQRWLVAKTRRDKWVWLSKIQPRCANMCQ